MTEWMLVFTFLYFGYGVTALPQVGPYPDKATCDAAGESSSKEYTMKMQKTFWSNKIFVEFICVPRPKQAQK